MPTKSRSIGETIMIFRNARGMSRSELAELIGISNSHLEKIENGVRKPSMETFQKILDILKIDLVMCNNKETVQEKCAAEVNDIIMNSTASQAQYMAKVVKCMSDNIVMVS